MKKASNNKIKIIITCLIKKKMKMMIICLIIMAEVKFNEKRIWKKED
jgi:hypothetical protein